MNVYLLRHINKFFDNKPFQQIMSTISATTNRVLTNNVYTFYFNKFCQQIMSTNFDSQLASTNCVSTNKVDKLYINKFCQQIMSTNPDNQLCCTEQRTLNNSELLSSVKKSDWCIFRLVNSRASNNSVNKFSQITLRPKPVWQQKMSTNSTATIYVNKLRQQILAVN